MRQKSDTIKEIHFISAAIFSLTVMLMIELSFLKICNRVQTIGNSYPMYHQKEYKCEF